MDTGSSCAKSAPAKTVMLMSSRLQNMLPPSMVAGTKSPHVPDDCTVPNGQESAIRLFRPCADPHRLTNRRIVIGRDLAGPDFGLEFHFPCFRKSHPHIADLSISTCGIGGKN